MRLNEIPDDGLLEDSAVSELKLGAPLLPTVERRRLPEEARAEDIS